MRKNIYLLAIFIFCISADTNAQAIETIAGGMQVGFGGDGGPATDALLNEPGGIAVDASGNVYFGDELNYRVRRIDATGIITTFAGNGEFSNASNNVPATATELYYPQAISVDNSGNVYICDGGLRVLKVNPATGIITAIAGNGVGGFSGDGGPATRAEMLNLTGIIVDNVGNLYISDCYNYRVREVDTSGIITTIAGTGGTGYSGDGGPAVFATFGYIYGLAVDLAGNVYIADAGSECVRKIDKATGIINTVAGNHYGAGTLAGGYSGDGGPATDAEFNFAKYIAVDNIGNLYIADLNNNRVRKVDTTGIITTIAGDGIPGYNGDGDNPASKELFSPKGVTVGANGNIYIPEKDNNRIRVITPYSLSVKELNNPAENTSVFPDPATDEITIKTGIEVYNAVTIYNSIGQLFIQQGINLTQTKVDIRGLPADVYFITLSGYAGRRVVRFVKL